MVRFGLALTYCVFFNFILLFRLFISTDGFFVSDFVVVVAVVFVYYFVYALRAHKRTKADYIDHVSVCSVAFRIRCLCTMHVLLRL